MPLISLIANSFSLTTGPQIDFPAERKITLLFVTCNLDDHDPERRFRQHPGDETVREHGIQVPEYCDEKIPEVNSLRIFCYVPGIVLFPDL